VAEWEDAGWFPNEVFTRMAELGYLGLKYPERYGGQGGDYVHDAVLAEELTGAGSGGLSAGIGAHIGIATPPIWKFGTEEQKQRFLAPAIRGEKIAALGITEPDAGSDVAGLRTFARRADGGYVVNGSKTYITNGVRADYVVTAYAKGLQTPAIVRRHVLKNAGIPVVTMAGVEVADLMTGAIVVETIFNWPGVGRLASQAMVTIDYPLVQTVVFWAALITIVMNLLVDLSYAWLDPRTRQGRR